MRSTDLYSNREATSMNNYQNTAFTSINNGLRSDDVSPFAQSNADNLSAAIRKSPPLTEDTTVYRGAGFGFPELQEGQTFQDKGFTSVAKDESISKRFIPKSNSPDGPGTQMIINMPAGSKAAWMGNSETEMLINRGSSFRVTRRRVQPNGRVILNMDLVQ